MLVGAEKIAQHVECVGHIGCVHFSASNAHGTMMP
jgi:hypothetical protein